MLLLLILSSCGRQESGGAVPDVKTESEKEADGDAPVLALVLTSRDAGENEKLIESFREETEKAGAELLVRFPDVSEAEAVKAWEETGNFVLCDVNPIEYQMLIINELVAENVDVIAIHPNHSEALEPVLTAARAVGIRVCAFGQKVGEESCDRYAGTDEAPEAAAGLLFEKER